MLFHQTARQQRSECVHVGGRVKRNDWCQRLWTGLTKPARTTALHGCQLDEWPRCTGEPLRTRWVALKFTFHCQTFASCNEFLHGKIWSIFLLNVTTIERSYETCKSWSLCSCFRLYHELPEAHAKELWQHKISHSFWSFHYKYESYKMTVMTHLRRVGSESQRGGGSSHIIYSKQHYVVIFVRCVPPPSLHCLPSAMQQWNAGFYDSMSDII